MWKRKRLKRRGFPGRASGLAGTKAENLEHLWSIHVENAWEDCRRTYKSFL